MAEHGSPTLFFGYQTQGAKGTAATGTHLAYGTGGARQRMVSGNTKVRNVGSAALNFIKGGGAMTDINVTLDSIHSYAPMLLAARTAGLLPWFTHSGGYNEASDKGWHTRDCHVNTMSISLAAGDAPGLLTGTFGIIGHKSVKNTAAEVVTDPTVTQFAGYEAVCLYGGAAFEMMSFEMTVNNNLRPKWALAGAARTVGEKRYWDYLTEGPSDVSGSVTLFEPWTTDLGGDTVTGADLVILLTNAVSGDIIRLTAGTATFDSDELSTPKDDSLTVPMEFTAKTFVAANL